MVDIDPKPATMAAVGRLYNLMVDRQARVVGLFNHLRVYQYLNAQLEHCSEAMQVEALLSMLANHKVCMRIASTYFVGTAIHYLRTLLSEEVPQVDCSALAAIV